MFEACELMPTAIPGQLSMNMQGIKALELEHEIDIHDELLAFFSMIIYMFTPAKCIGT